MPIRLVVLALFVGLELGTPAQVADSTRARLSGRGVTLELSPQPEYVPSGGCPRFFQLRIKSAATEEVAVWIVLKAADGWTFSPNHWMAHLAPGDTWAIPVTASFTPPEPEMREPVELVASLYASVDRYSLEGAARIVVRIPPEHLLGERLCR